MYTRCQKRGVCIYYDLNRDRRVLWFRAELPDQKRINKIDSIYIDLSFRGQFFKEISSVRIESDGPTLDLRILWSDSWT
jgi:hypothetical protein